MWVKNIEIEVQKKNILSFDATFLCQIPVNTHRQIKIEDTSDYRGQTDADEVWVGDRAEAKRADTFSHSLSTSLPERVATDTRWVGWMDEKVPKVKDERCFMAWMVFDEDTDTCAYAETGTQMTLTHFKSWRVHICAKPATENQKPPTVPRQDFFSCRCHMTALNRHKLGHWPH